MNSEELILNANDVVTYLQKPASDFTKADIINFIRNNDIRMLNFMYPGGDGKLKTLNFDTHLWRESRRVEPFPVYQCEQQ